MKRIGAGVAVLMLAAAGCGSTARHADAIQVVDARLPAPASPDVAAVYLTVRNRGSAADRLLSVSSPDAAASQLMTEQDQGSMGSMAPIASVVIPAHGEASLAPGHDHAMLERPTTTLSVGQRVPVTLHFARAGNVTIQVPVVPYSSLVGGSSSDSGSGSMGGMAGMG